MFRVLWLLGCLSGASAGDFYTAGVAEFRPLLMGGSSEQLLADNLSGYLELIASASGQADILVFPEATLNSVLQLTAVPESTEQSLCEAQPGDDEYIASFLRQLACAAQEAHLYLVINVKERAEESKEEHSPRGYLVYNTNVVFDRRGAVVSRYRKWNLYLEPSTNRTELPQLATFSTDFGVTFGHFVCFDMLFYEPAQELVEQLGIRHVIVTKMFNSELPFLTASQFQQGWAWANRVNLLAAGASLPLAGMSGSGIYATRQGALARLMVTDQVEGERKLLLASVPLNPDEEESAKPLDEEPQSPEKGKTMSLKLLQQPDLQEFTTWELPMVASSSVVKRLCQADLCCEFEAQWTPVGPAPGTYRLGVWVGERRYEEEQYSTIRLCGLFACGNSSVDSCGLVADTDVGGWDDDQVEFVYLSIRGEFVHKPRRLIMPSTVTRSHLYALQPSQFSWSQEESANVTHIEMELRQAHRQLLTFAIYGNYYDEHAGGGAGGEMGAPKDHYLILVLMGMVTMMHLIRER
ncbi:vanin-like protein 3 [Drosophila kikkawai]|uniref:Vanin-like protein 3 n=1 Tax=Drosophila kikkawai TaxID=30033 RepID=A0A6P4I308_DROKI|nr:vanin-like protein 3 [Drosophila kikkawai]